MAEQDDRKVSIGQIEGILEDRGFATIGLILCLPFVQPIPLPGLSILFGLAVAAMGLRLILGRSPKLPRFVVSRQIESKTVERICATGIKFFSYLEKFFSPRWLFLYKGLMLRLIGLSMLTSGIALCLPLPPVILFSNSIPAWSVILLCLGILERDGLFVLLGHVF